MIVSREKVLAHHRALLDAGATTDEATQATATAYCISPECVAETMQLAQHKTHAQEAQAEAA